MSEGSGAPYVIVHPDEQADPQRMFLGAEGEPSQMAIDGTDIEKEHDRLQERAPWSEQITHWAHVQWEE
eukprot:10622702-Karenia_brevis.AAC.1